MRYPIKSLIGSVKDTNRRGEAVRSSKVVTISQDGSRATIETQDGPIRTQYESNVVLSEIRLNPKYDHPLGLQDLPGNRYRTF